MPPLFLIPVVSLAAGSFIPRLIIKILIVKLEVAFEVAQLGIYLGMPIAFARRPINRSALAPLLRLRIKRRLLATSIEDQLGLCGLPAQKLPLLCE